MKTYALGSNGNYQLGLGHDEDLDQPTECLKGLDISHIASGGNHTLAITTEGKLYGAGLTNNGQLTGEKKHVIDWDPIFTGFKVKNAACGWEFSLIVSEDNQIYSCGQGQKGELGINGVKESTEFKKIDDFPPYGRSINDVKAGMAHAVALLDDGSVYGWGAARKRQLGEPVEKVINTPRKFDTSDKTTHIACGRDFTVLGNSQSGNVKVLGRDIDVPQQPFKNLVSGWSTIHTLLENGKVCSYGNNSHDQHASQDKLKDLVIDQISAGTEHVVAATKDGNCVSWGWKEHGNCGKEFELCENADKVWGGYATTFFSTK